MWNLVIYRFKGEPIVRRIPADIALKGHQALKALAEKIIRKNVKNPENVRSWRAVKEPYS